MNILFPTDFSEIADNAFVYALKVADALGGSVITAHVYSAPDLKGAALPNTLREVYDSIQLESFEEYREHVPHLNKIAEEVNLPHVQIRHAIRENQSGLVRTLLRQAEKEESEFIVMGTSGATGLKGVFFGSVASEVMENAKCPVLAIPATAEYAGINHIVHATDYSESDRLVLAEIQKFSQEFNALLTIVHVDIAHTDLLSRRMEIFKETIDPMPNCEFVVLDDISVEAGLERYIERNEVDILSLGITKRNFFQELFTRSTAKYAAKYFRRPILGINPLNLQ